MSEISVYTFEDADGQDYGSFSTQDFTEAERYAQDNHLRMICNEYEFTDSYMVDDFTGKDNELHP